MAERWIDPVHVRRRFDRAASTYARHDELPREVAKLLSGRLDTQTAKPERVVDLGAGTGRDTAQLKQRWPDATVLALDASRPMLIEARRQNRWRRPIHRVAADVRALPLPDGSVDVLWANLCFQWIDDLPALFGECARVLKQTGQLVFSTLGPDSLRELRAAWAGVDEGAHVGRFLDMHDVGDAMVAAGLRDVVLEVDRAQLTYSTPRALLDELRGLGATLAHPDRARRLTGRRRFTAMLDAYEAQRVDGRIPASWEIVTGQAFGPAPGQARRTAGGGEVASFSIDRLRGSRR